MTRGNLLIVIVLSLALVGMFFWTLTLHNRQAERGGGGGDPSPGRGGENSARLEELERKVTKLAGMQEASRAELSELDRRLREVEVASAEQGLKIASLAAGTPVAEGAEPAPTGNLRAAIEGVLEEQRAEERRRRNEQSARGMARWLLSDVEPTAEQSEQFVKVVTGYLDEREKIRERFSGETRDDQARDAELKALDEDRNAKLLTIFDAAQYSKIEERLNRGRRMMDGNRGAPFRRGR